MSSQYSQSKWMKPSDKLKLVGRIRELWAADPTLTTAQITAATDAPRNVIDDVRRRLVKAGLLPTPKAGAKARGQ